MRTYNAIDGQSLADICMNTYGSMDFFYKLLTDNNISSANALPFTGQQFTWDETLVVDFVVGQTLDRNNIKYATASSGNGNTFYVVEGSPVTTPPAGGGTNPPQPPSNMYQKTSAFFYESASTGGETTITFPSLQNKTILQIEKNIQPLLPSEYAWNSLTGVLTLNEPIFADERISILYQEMITI